MSVLFCPLLTVTVIFLKMFVEYAWPVLLHLFFNDLAVGLVVLCLVKLGWRRGGGGVATKHLLSV